MIKHKHEYIFIHIPKNAGESIEISLGGYRKKECLWEIEKGFPLQHLTARQMKVRVGDKDFNNYFKFSFVRNPYSKCISEYFWTTLKTRERLNRKRWTNPLNFNQWVKIKLEKLIRESETTKVIALKMHNLPQYKFIYNTSGKCMVDFIGRFENLQEDFNIVCDKIGIPRQKLPHENKTKHKHYTKYYDDETRQIVAEKYAKDIEYFGYEFGE
jgi:hypothetical protein